MVSHSTVKLPVSLDYFGFVLYLSCFIYLADLANSEPAEIVRAKNQEMSSVVIF